MESVAEHETCGSSMTTQDTQTGTPAYVPFDTFEGFIDTLKQVTVPDHIDKAMMSKMSGALQSHLVSALRFLNLIGPDNRTQEGLHQLVQAYKTEDWKPTLARLIEFSYAPIIGDLNIKSGIAKKLRERFKETSKLDGATLDKAIRFYLKALKAAGVEVSPHFFTRKSPGRRSGANGRARQETQPAQEERTDETPPAPTNDQPPPGMILIPIPFPGRAQGGITFPRDLKQGDLEMIDAAVGILKAYAKANDSH